MLVYVGQGLCLCVFESDRLNPTIVRSNCAIVPHNNTHIRKKCDGGGVYKYIDIYISESFYNLYVVNISCLDKSHKHDKYNVSIIDNDCFWFISLLG